MTKHSFTQRMIGAARIDSAIYNEVEHDTSATGQAAGVVAIVAVCSAIGGIEGGSTGMLAGVVSAIVGWLVWSAVTYLVGDKLLGGTATWGELLRALGFAQAPGVLYVIAMVPGFGILTRLIVGVWILVCGIVALREALDFGTGKAILTAVIGWVVMMAAMWTLLLLAGAASMALP